VKEGGLLNGRKKPQRVGSNVGAGGNGEMTGVFFTVYENAKQLGLGEKKKGGTP